MANNYLHRRHLLLAGLLPLIGPVQAQSFGPMTNYFLGANTSPNALVVGDVNGDGKPDAMTSNNGNLYSVLPGTSTGGFQAAATYLLGLLGSTNGLALGDVNRDGKPDLVTADHTFGTVRLLLGTGTGGFNQSGTTYATGNTTGTLVSVALGDLNGDGQLDIITANPTTNTVDVLLGTSTGTYPWVATYATPSNLSPLSLTVGDVNGDGNTDVIVTANSSTVGILLGIGTGALLGTATYSTGTGTQPWGVALGDINGDGKPDLVTANRLSDTYSILLGTGLGLFQSATVHSVSSGSYPTSIALSDINGDGRLDIVLANYLTSNISVLLNTTPLAAHATLPGTSATLHPNPTSTVTILSVSGLPAAVAQVQVALFDATGRAVGQQQLATAQGTSRTEVPTTGLAAGLYVLRLTAYDALGQPIGSLPAQHLSVR
jgi:hypothetical protein